jgi:hypothetical protein
MKELEKLIAEIEAVENMYLDKKHILKRLKLISKENKSKIKGIGIPYDAFSNEFKKAIDSIDAALSKENKREIKEPCDWCKRIIEITNDNYLLGATMFDDGVEENCKCNE